MPLARQQLEAFAARMHWAPLFSPALRAGVGAVVMRLRASYLSSRTCTSDLSGRGIGTILGKPRWLRIFAMPGRSIPHAINRVICGARCPFRARVGLHSRR
jgi:hypothetical protein